MTGNQAVVLTASDGRFYRLSAGADGLLLDPFQSLEFEDYEVLVLV
ncbi:hypothetical protein [Brucella pituitosa]